MTHGFHVEFIEQVLEVGSEGFAGDGLALLMDDCPTNEPAQ